MAEFVWGLLLLLFVAVLTLGTAIGMSLGLIHWYLYICYMYRRK